tara:strand:+ start:545 stop:691 length:147 start_codon:yes stop_codon:yes gene_type:complete
MDKTKEKQEVIVTPEMAKVGATVLYDWLPDVSFVEDDDGRLASEIFAK